MFLFTIPTQWIPIPVILSLFITVTYVLHNFGYRIRLPHVFASTTNIPEQIETWSEEFAIIIHEMYKLKHASDKTLRCLFLEKQFNIMKPKLNEFFQLYQRLYNTNDDTTNEQDHLQRISDNISTIFQHHGGSYDDDDKQFQQTRKDMFTMLIFLCKHFCDFKTVRSSHSNYYESLQFEGLINYYEDQVFLLPKSKLTHVKNDLSYNNNLYFLNDNAFESLAMVDPDSPLFNDDRTLNRVDHAKVTDFVIHAFKQFCTSLDRLSTEQELLPQTMLENAKKLLSLFGAHPRDITNYKHVSYLQLFEFMISTNTFPAYLTKFDHTTDLYNIEKTLYDLEGNTSRSLIMYEEQIADLLLRRFHTFVLVKLYNSNFNDIQTLLLHKDEILRGEYLLAVHALHKLQVTLAIDFPRLLAYDNFQSKNFQRDKYIINKLQFNQLYKQIMTYVPNASDLRNVFSSNELTFHTRLNNPILNMLISFINWIRHNLNRIINNPSGFIKSALNNV